MTTNRRIIMSCLISLAIALYVGQSSKSDEVLVPDRELGLSLITSGPAYLIDYVPGQGALPHLVGAGSGVSRGVTVFAHNQVLQYITPIDIIRNGLQEPNVTFWRCFRSDLALKGLSSPGMPAGWITNYDLKIKPQTDKETWRSMKLTYPNGSKLDVVPLLDAKGWPTGEFQHANGDPFVIRGVAGKTVNSWDSIEVFWKVCRWFFTIAGDGNYRLSTVKPAVGDLAVNFFFDNQGRLTGASSGMTNKWIANLNYGQNGFLDSIVLDHKTYVRFYYEQNQEALKGKWVLRGTSELASDPKDEKMFHQYNYKIIKDQFLLSMISTPSPATNSKGEWVSSKIQYSDEGKVQKLTDANGNSTSVGGQ